MRRDGSDVIMTGKRMVRWPPLVVLLLACLFSSAPAWSAFDDLNNEEMSVIERRAEAQKLFKKIQRDGDAGKASPDEVVQVVNRSRLTLNGAEEEAVEDEQKYVNVMSAESLSSGIVEGQVIRREKPRRSMLLQFAIAAGFFLVIAGATRFMPKQRMN